MPADYSTTARALSLPASPPPRSPSTSFQPIRPPWSTRRSLSQNRSGSAYETPRSAFRDRMIDGAEKIHRRVVKTVEKMTWLQRILAVIALVAVLSLSILFLVFNSRIFGWLEPYAEKWKATRGGWLILWALTFMTAFPPIIGYSTCLTTAGFVYGFPEGWFIGASATIIGSFCSFLVSRTLFKGYVHRLVANDTRFAALTLTLKHDGLKLLCMIRLCPLPYSLSNGAMSTFQTVQPLQFALATTLVTPKLLVHIFIGSRMAAIARSGEKMSAGTKAVNWISIIGGAIIGAFTGWYIYQKVVTRARQLEREEQADIRRSAAHQAEHQFSDNPDEQAAGANLLTSDDDIDYFNQGGLEEGYRDETTDDEYQVFSQGDGDEEEAIGLHHQSR